MKPNILVIHVDQLRQDCTSVYGNKQVKTPNLTALAADSVVHTNHFSVYPICTPSRYSLLCGQYTHQHLGWGNHCTLPAGIDTFPRLLKENGWHTAAVGKMHFTPTYLDVGFERMTLAEQDGDGRFDDDYHAYLMEQNQLDDIDLIDQRQEYRRHATRAYFDSFGVQPSDLPEEHHSTSWITRQSLHELDSWNTEGGNLLMMGYIKPHHPFDPPARYADLYDAAEIEPLRGYSDAVPSVDADFSGGYFDNSQLTLERLKKMTALYYATITQIDDGIGEIIAKLRQKQLYDNTMIIFTSDHGDFLGFHHMALKGNHMYDPLMKIPLIIKYPAQENAGRVVSTLNSNIDIAGDVLAVCGIPHTQLYGGIPERPYVFAEQLVMRDYGAQYCYMIRSDRYKLLLDGSMETVLFFDLEKDPDEFVNLAANSEYAQALDKHKQYLLECLAFDAPSRIHLDDDAPVNLVQNKTDEKRRAQRAAYMRQHSAVGNSITE